jgi:hypothetical protein
MHIKALWPLVLSVAAVAATTATGGAQVAAAPRAHVWVDLNGGTCARSRNAVAYRDAAACPSVDSAWDACRPGDRIIVKSAAYPAQTITGDKRAPGCNVIGEKGTTIGDLVTAGAFLTLRNVTIEVGDAKHAGWKATANNVTLRGVRLHGQFVRVDIYRANEVRWIGGELGTAGQVGGKRVCGRDAEPVQIGEAARVTIDGVRFHPQDADPTPSSCSANGFHLEMIRLDGGTSFFTLRNSTFDSGDHSGTASIFVTEPGGGVDPHDLTFENNFFGTSESIFAVNVHPNVSPCVNFTFAYNTFLKSPGVFQCSSAVNVKWIGNLGPNGPSSPCFGTSTNNVWQDPGRDNCGSDRWIRGNRGQTDRLGLGGPDGFRLQARSPAINAGERSGYCTTTLRARDHDGQGRPRSARCDAGADEYDVPGRGPVDTSLTDIRWSRTASGLRALALTLRVGGIIAAEVRLVRRGGTIATRRFARLSTGSRKLTLALGANVSSGPARLSIALEDAARDQKIVRRTVQIPR